MLRALLLILLWAACLPAAVRLYLKDGTSHTVREYHKQADRVRYYSTERGDWEEIPLDLVDLKRTEEELRRKEASIKEETAAADAEEKAERAQRREIERIPMETGVFIAEGEKVRVLKIADSKIVNNKRRSILKAMSPIPIVAGKSTVELAGLKSATEVSGDRPEFYIRLAAEERFGIVRVVPGKATRVVETLNIIPVSKEIIEEMDTVEVFRKQLGDGLYKLWPTKALAPGQYAVVEYTEGKGNIQIWDFTLTVGR
ncbi:MAG TPA: hypothetical protein VMZ52_17095 [Bryobacteraceae bacterium]|nr:hypothetical protein [Bryobacteraceae bacterium]